MRKQWQFSPDFTLDLNAHMLTVVLWWICSLSAFMSLSSICDLSVWNVNQQQENQLKCYIFHSSFSLNKLYGESEGQLYLNVKVIWMSTLSRCQGNLNVKIEWMPRLSEGLGNWITILSEWQVHLKVKVIWKSRLPESQGQRFINHYKGLENTTSKVSHIHISLTFKKKYVFLFLCVCVRRGSI